jgi:rubredoxin
MANEAWLWTCPECGVSQALDDIRTIEIEEPGKNSRIEYHGKIRPSHDTKHGIWYSCLVCGNFWTEDPTPGGHSITFLHPITERDEERGDRDAC